MKNLKTLTAIAAVMLAGLAAPMAAATAPDHCTVTGFTDKDDAALGTPNLGTLTSSESKHYWRISGLDGRVSIQITPAPNAATLSFRVVEDVSGCTQQDPEAPGLVVIPDANSGEFYVLIERGASAMSDVAYSFEVLNTPA